MLSIKRMKRNENPAIASKKKANVLIYFQVFCMLNLLLVDISKDRAVCIARFWERVKIEAKFV